MFLLQVLHGCRQSVLSEVRLTPRTDEIPAVNLYLTDFKISGKHRFHLGQRQVAMALMTLGYKRATRIFTK